jgi:hypothetical protein
LNLIEDKISAYEMVERVVKDRLGKFTKSDIQEHSPTLARQTIEKALKADIAASLIEVFIFTIPYFYLISTSR